jgi:hypothetical protein
LEPSTPPRRVGSSEPDAAKLRKKVVDQPVEMALLRQVMKEIAKERDQYQRRTRPKYREAMKLLTGPNYRVIINALHFDRRKSRFGSRVEVKMLVPVAFPPGRL